MPWNYDMAAAPQDRPILGKCSDKCGSSDCGYHTGTGTSLCLYHAHADGLSRVSDGPHVVVWGGGWADSEEDGGGWLPDSWFRSDSEFEVAANPVAWMEIPE
ncbi:MAG TPA: hypothetical protein H9899_07260 [Candidatus Sphingomonas excrementigallinarum]|nr:hypothetical protein [Candidatus Sphingomonas excrementigallinarum]